MKDTKEKIEAQLIKKGYTKEEAALAIEKSQLSEDEMFSLFQEYEAFENKIEKVNIRKVPELLSEGYELSLKLQKLNRKISDAENTTWVDDFVKKNFNPIYKATNELNEILEAKVKELSEDSKVVEFVNNGGDIEEKKILDRLELYKARKKAIKELDEKYHVNDKMREEFQKAVLEKTKSIIDPLKEKADVILDKLNIIQQTIASSLFITLEEASIMIVVKNFFSIFFEAIDDNGYNKVEELVKASYENKQKIMKKKHNIIARKVKRKKQSN